MDSARRRCTVLATGTDRDALLICETYLRHLGYEVQMVEDVERVLETAHRMTPDLVITMHPTLLRSGRCVTEAIRADAALAATPVLSLASWVSASDLERAASAGVTESLPIPASLPELLRAVERLIASAPRSPRVDP